VEVVSNTTSVAYIEGWTPSVGGAVKVSCLADNVTYPLSQVQVEKNEKAISEVDALNLDNVLSISSVEILTPSIFEIRERKVVLNLQTSSASIVEVEPTIAKPKFALSLIGSYGIFQKDYVANEEKFLAYSNARNESEKELEILSTKLSLSYALTDLFQLSSGIKIQQINEEFSWIGSYTVNEIGQSIDISEDKLNEVFHYY